MIFTGHGAMKKKKNRLVSRMNRDLILGEKADTLIK